jgi:uncharacterized protein
MWSTPKSPTKYGHWPGITARSAGLAISLTAGLFFLWCATKSTLRLERYHDAVRQGNFLPVAEDIKNRTDLYGQTNRFLYYTDLGMLYHYAAAYDSSTAYLLRAAAVYDELYTRSLSREAASLLVNDNVRPYRSKPYEIVWVHQVCQLNYLAQHQGDEALVEARATQLLFDQWQRQNQADNHYFTDGMFHYFTSIAYDQANQTDDAMISLFDAVRAFQLGPVALPPSLGTDAGCLLEKNGRAEDRDKLHLKPCIEGDGPSGPANGQTEIIVVGYAGKGPALVEEEWWGDWVRDGLLVLHHSIGEGQTETMSLPAPALPEEPDRDHGHREKTKSGTTVFIKIALPRLETYPSQTAYFTVEGAGAGSPQKTMVVNNFNLQAAKQLDDARTSIMARTVIRTVLRTLAAQEAKEKMRTDSPIANLLLNLTTDVVTSQMEKADTRLCFFIPQTVQIARLAVEPGTHHITVIARDQAGNPLTERTFDHIQVEQGKKEFVFISSFN